MGAEREMTLAEWVGSLGQPQHRAHREYVELLATLDAERKRAEEAERGMEIAREELGRMRDWRDKERTRAADAEQREKAGWARVEELTTTLDAARKRAEAAEAERDEAVREASDQKAKQAALVKELGEVEELLKGALADLAKHEGESRG